VSGEVKTGAVAVVAVLAAVFGLGRLRRRRS
jgi:uncharacterized protein (TIGR03382 family)